MSRNEEVERAWAQGVADAGVRLIGAVAAYEDPQDPLIDLLVQRLGSLLPPWAQDHDVLKRGSYAVQVAPTTAPDGSLRVLLQLPNGFMLLWPAGARELAAMLTTVAEEVEHG